MAEITILRAQWDSRKQMWKISKKTMNGAGGWARFGNNWYMGKMEAEKVIHRLSTDFPDIYETEA